VVIRLPTLEIYLSFLQAVSIGSVAHPASYLMGDEGLLPPGYNGRGMKLPTHLHLIPGLRMNVNILHCPICLHAVHGDNFSFAIINGVSLGRYDPLTKTVTLYPIMYIMS
jgi:hypothetical protein